MPTNSHVPNAILASSVRRLLESDPATVSTAAERAAHAVRVYEETSERLAQVVGRDGVRALFDRTLVISQAQFPWLSDALTRTQEPPWQRLRACLERQPVELGADASLSLITTFVSQLGRLIGEDLVLRLLHEAWPQVFPAGAQPVAKKEPT